MKQFDLFECQKELDIGTDTDFLFIAECFIW